MQRTEGSLFANCNLSLVNPEPAENGEYDRILENSIKAKLRIIKFRIGECLIQFGIRKQITNTYIID